MKCPSLAVRKMMLICTVPLNHDHQKECDGYELSSTGSRCMHLRFGEFCTYCQPIDADKKLEADQAQIPV